jgi:hypothetical protein
MNTNTFDPAAAVDISISDMSEMGWLSSAVGVFGQTLSKPDISLPI